MCRPHFIMITKFVGVCSLGLLTGISFSTSYASIKSLLTLPSAPSAHRSFLTLKNLLATLTNRLSITSTVTLLTAYALSPSSHKHPYLLLTSLIPAISYGYNLAVLAPQERRMQALVEENGEKGVNGEELRSGLEGWERSSWVETGVYGLGFGMGVVGLWGDSVMISQMARRW